MSKESFDNLASKATAGSTTVMAVVVMFAYNNLQAIERKMDDNIRQTSTLIDRLEKRIEQIEKRIEKGER